MFDMSAQSGAFLTVLSWLLVTPFLLSLSYLVIELAAGLYPTRVRGGVEDALENLAILIPAHNEQHVIGDTIGELKRTASFARIVVVADNCSDRTAEVAKSAGADVIERFDDECRGKGYALACGREYLANSAPHAVIVLDADCRISGSSAKALGAKAIASGQAVQAINLFAPDRSLSAQLQISNFAMLVKNRFRMRGMFRLGGSAALLGTGMAFPWHKFIALPLATGDAAEDIQMTIQIISSGETILFPEVAEVWSDAETVQETAGQRKRWEHGFLGHALRQAAPTVLKGILSASPPLVALGLHLLVPPLALLLILSGLASIASGLLVFGGASILPLATLLTLITVTAILLAFLWATKGREYLSLRAVASIPFYLLWKVPIYLSFVTKRQRNWDD
ncbi:glycosyltransferase family 2 protein [Qipengyuania sphaerica]|uniref:glycosyltransferase family 2 protein n=1 Tax=Qipengyuania sphaerica TaxID=2867243 RepID=UPI001C87C4A8|nr:glycosyltransferase family 2 protein [Qipengyuania sphaerica]MBX7539396.1 glycosyltransferase family 2 protein [Qipengyuania sphaerica]